MTILIGDSRVTIPTIERGSVQAIVTSPPYFGLRLYGDATEEIGKERDVGAYVQSIVDVMRLCREALREDGCAWVNLGDSYASQTKGSGGKGKSTLTTSQKLKSQERQSHEERDLDCGIPDGNALLIPFRVATALQADGWTLRAMLPWIKLASMPESVRSRPSIAHEYVLFLTKRPSGYFYDADAVRVAGSEKTNGWTAKPTAPSTDKWSHVGAGHDGKRGAPNPLGRSLRSSDFWRAGARSAGEQLLAAADGEAIGMLTNDDAPAALVVNPKGSGIEHFAMWPVRLVAPMILAGTPEAGSCSVCGAPWVRVVERKSDQAQKSWSGAGRGNGCMVGGGHEGRTGTWSVESQTLGFKPSCPHVDAPTRPAIVLDPFAGAFTSIGVAEALGRTAIGCELYQKTADLLPLRIDVVRTEMLEILEAGDPRRADIELAQKRDRHAGKTIPVATKAPDERKKQLGLFSPPARDAPPASERTKDETPSASSTKECS